MATNTPKTETEFMLLAMEEASKCISEPGKNSPCVGAVIVKDGVFLGSAFRGELKPGEHAEYTLLQRKLENIDVTNAIVYTTLEPCSGRNPPKIACAKWLFDRKVGEVVIGLLDPDPRIYGNGMKALMDARIRIRHFPAELRERLKQIDATFRSKFVANTDTTGTATFNYMRNNGIFTIGHGEVLFDTKWEKNAADTINLRNDASSIKSIGIAIHAKTFDDVSDPGVYDMSTWNIPVKEGEIAVLRSQHDRFALVKVNDVKYKGASSDDRDELTIEFKILTNPIEFLVPPDVSALNPVPASVEAEQKAIPSDAASSSTTADLKTPLRYRAFFSYLQWLDDPEAIRDGVASLDRLNKVLRETPEEVRKVLLEVMKRSTADHRARHPMAAICREIELALHVSPAELREYVAILERHKIALLDEDDRDGLYKVFLRRWPIDWNVWDDMRGYCDKTGRSLAELIVSNRFDLLS